jgi:hypothetical protein
MIINGCTRYFRIQLFLPFIRKNDIKTTGATSAAGTTCPSGVPVLSLEFKWGRVAQYLIF